MLIDFFFPNRCMQCTAIISALELTCISCQTKIDYTHFDYTDNILLQKCRLLFPTEHAFALMHFDQEGLSQKILHQLKYGRREIVGKIVADWTVQKLMWNVQDKPEIITTVPLHPKKQKQRGYNQLHLFANQLSEQWHIPVDHELLKRNTFGKSQASKKREDRGKIKTQFSLNKEVNHKHVLIIDDVFTTGNTMSLVAWELLKNKTNKVSVLVMAID